MNDVICPNGHRNRAGARFCSVCQSPISQATSPGSSQKGSPKLNSRHLLWIGFFILGTVLVVSLAAILWLSREENPEKGDSVPTLTAGTSTIESTATATVMSEAAVPTIVTEPETTAPVAPTSESGPEETPTLDSGSLIPNLLTNGDFSQNWDVGWQRVFGENVTGTQRTEVIEEERGLSGRAIQITRSGADSLKLEQQVPIIQAQMRYQAQTQLEGSLDVITGAESMAVMMLIYHGADLAQPPLGYSLWVNGPKRETDLFGQTPLPPIGPNVSIRWIDEGWTSIDMDIRQEIINSLPTVSPDEVRHVSVVLFGIGSENCPPEGCTTNILATDIILSQ